jgi:hypothetical protein
LRKEIDGVHFVPNIRVKRDAVSKIVLYYSHYFIVGYQALKLEGLICELNVFLTFSVHYKLKKLKILIEILNKYRAKLRIVHTLV